MLSRNEVAKRGFFVALSGSRLNSAACEHSAQSAKTPDGSTPIRVVLALASELDRWAWSIVIGNQEDMELVATPSSGHQVFEALSSHAADVLVLDEEILGSCDQRALLERTGRLHASGLILVTTHQPDYSIEPSQYPFLHTRLLKGFSAPKLLDAIRAGAKNSARLSAAGEPG